MRLTTSVGDQPDRTRHWGRLVAIILVALVLLVAVVGYTPLLDDDLSTSPDPATDLEGAQSKAADLAALDGPEVNPVCQSRIIDHGERTAEAVVLLHGYTNCPAQYAVVAQAYVDQGVSVVVPRLPHHGMQNRLTTELSELRPRDLVEVTDQAVDIAAGLGERVTVVGLSAGGTLAGWAGAQRDDVDEVVLLAPLVVPKVVPSQAVAPVARISRYTPDVFLWWDSDLKEAEDTPPYAYPRYSLRSLGAVLAVGGSARDGVVRDTSMDRLTLVTNDNDGAISNAAAQDLADELAGVADQRTDHVFEADLGFGHDIVDPQGEDADDIAQTYMVLADLLDLPDLVETFQREG